MIEITFDKEQYAEKLGTKVSNLLSSQLMSIKPFNEEDAKVMDFINNRCVEDGDTISPSEFDMAARFCSPILVGKTNEHSNPYNPNATYKTLTFCNMKGESSLQINHSSFLYDMYPLVNEKRNGFTAGKCVDKPVRCTMDFQGVNPSIFDDKDGGRLLYLYSFPSVNKFGKESRCYRFLSGFSESHEDMERLRVAIIKAQWFSLTHLVRHPSIFAFSTIFFDNRGRRLGGMSLSYDVWAYFEECFNKQYETMIQERLNEVEDVMRTHSIKSEEEFWIFETQTSIIGRKI